MQGKLQIVCYFPEKLFDHQDLFDSEVIFLSVLLLANVLKIGRKFEHCSNSSDIGSPSEIRPKFCSHLIIFGRWQDRRRNRPSVCRHLKDTSVIRFKFSIDILK